MIGTIGFDVMLHTPPAKVSYQRLQGVFGNARGMLPSLVQTWLVGSLLMFAVAIAEFGIGSAVAFTAVIRPLIEVPVTVTLVNLGVVLRRVWFGEGGARGGAGRTREPESGT